MLTIQKNVSLLSYNTFGINAQAAFFTEINHITDLDELDAHLELQSKILVLGGGSNLLLTADVDRWVLQNKIKGISIVKEDENNICLSVGGGEIWHDFVMYCVANNWGGVENLSLIPGTVGAAPIQNIGAYGVEVKDVIEEVQAYSFEEKKCIVYHNQECAFAYRNSIFKSKLKDKMFITNVVFRLSKQHTLHIDYGTIRQELENMQITDIDIKAVSDAVIAIRQSKLPDPKVIGNAGSFFKNPEVDKKLFATIKIDYPNVVGFATEMDKIKIPAAWLIEQCGWKGYTESNFGVHKNQPLVLVNYGGAKGSDIVQLSEKIIDSVNNKFGISLEREVQIV